MYRKEFYIPFYDDRADYNTNAKSYYDFLARYNMILKELSNIVNDLTNRDIDVKETDSINLKKIGKWINDNECETKDDIIQLVADVKLSKEKVEKDFNGTKYLLDNGLIIKKDGLIYPNYDKLLNDLLLYVKELEKKIKYDDLENKINDLERTLDNMQGLNLTELKKDTDYTLKFYNDFYSPTNDLVLKVGENKDTVDIFVSSHSTSGKIIKHDGDLKDLEISLRPDKDIPNKSKVFSIIFKGKYAHLNKKEIFIDNTTPMLWHITPIKARASWTAQLTPHNINGEINYSWRNFSDGYSSQLKDNYTDILKLSWGSINSKITFKK